LLRIDQRRSVAALPERTCAAVTIVEVPHVPASERLHHASWRTRVLRGDEQMRVIRHEHVRVDLATRTLADVQKCREKALAVVVVDEARAPVVPPLEHMQYVTRKYDARWTWHDPSLHDDAVLRVIEPSHIRPTFKESDPFVSRSLTPLVGSLVGSWLAHATTGFRRTIRFATPPMTPTASASAVTRGVQSGVRPSAASSEYGPNPASAIASAPVQ
jgi:hypothetical protein